MSLYPTNEREEGIHASVEGLRDAAAALVGELERGEPDVSSLADDAEQMAWATASLLGRWRHLTRASPYRLAALDEAEEILQSVLTRVNQNADLGDVISLEDELALVTLTSARAKVAERLRRARTASGLPVRGAAQLASVAPAYLSELEAGKSGLPSDDVCARLEEALGVEIGRAHV